MVCSFCHHEFDEALTECPYCHRIVEKDAHSLTVEERESFDGATIEVDGTVCGGEGDRARSREYQERFDDGPAGRADDKGENNGAGLRIHTFHTRELPVLGPFGCAACLFHPAGLFCPGPRGSSGLFPVSAAERILGKEAEEVHPVALSNIDTLKTPSDFLFLLWRGKRMVFFNILPGFPTLYRIFHLHLYRSSIVS